MAEGIEVRHRKGCPKPSGGRCTCSPSYRVHIWDNRKRRRIRKTFPTMGAAKAWRAEALVALKKGGLQPSSPQTLAEAARAFLEGAEGGTVRDRSGRPYKPSTVRTYREKLEGYVLPRLGTHKLAELRRADVQAFVDELIASGISASSVRNTLDPLRAIYRYAIRRDLVAINPTQNLELPQAQGKRDRIATPEEAKALLDALPPEDRALWATAFYAGLRRGELRALRWEDVDLGASELHVRRAWDQAAGEIAPKTAASVRTVPVLGILRDHLDEHKLRTGRGGSDLVFGRTPDKAFTASTIDNRAKRAWKAAGLKGLTLHECRHTFASLLIRAGVDVKAVQTFMGHSSITQTVDQYGHLFPGSRDETRARLDAFLGSVAAPESPTRTEAPG